MRFIDRHFPLFFTFLILGPILGIGAVGGCNSQLGARHNGGTFEVRVPCDQVVFDVTWKGDSLWYATQSPGPNWAPETKRFRESSLLGVLEGEVVLIESRCGG
jgi:hypothetical protein